MGIVRRARWLRVALVAPVLAFALTASSQFAIRCTLTGLLIPESCCPASADPARPVTPDSQAALRDADCCERVTVAIDKAPVTGAEPWRAADVPVTSVIAAMAPSPTVARPVNRARAARPPGASPPLYVATHSFLI